MAEDFLTRTEMLLNATDIPERDRAALRLRVLTDHLCTRTDHGPDTLARIATALQDALGATGLDIPETVAARIVAHPQTDDAILVHLAGRGSEAAITALRAGRRLEASLLMRLAECGGSACASAIAVRADLTPQMAMVLFRRPEPDVLVALVGNPRFHLDRATATWLVSRARHDRALAQAMLARGPLACDLTPLFMFADAYKRNAMILDARRRDLGLVPEFRPALPHDVIAGIGAATSRREIDALIVILALRLGIPRAVMTRFFDDDGGEPLALVCNIAGVSPDQMLRLFCRLHGRRGDDPHVASLTRIVTDLAPQTVRRVLAAIVGRTPVGPSRGGPARVERMLRRQLANEGGTSSDETAAAAALKIVS